MGRPNLTRHPKFQRLARALGNAALARGSLELLWEVAYENGDPRLGSSGDLESAADWKGKRGVLTKALLDAGGAGRAGFIERAPGTSGRGTVYEIHDLEDHAPEYVKKRLEREIDRRKRGQTLRDLRVAAGQKGAAARWQPDGKQPPVAMAPGRAPDGKRMANGVTRAPARAREKLGSEQDDLSLPENDGSRRGRLLELLRPEGQPAKVFAEALGWSLPEVADQLYALERARQAETADGLWRRRTSP